jgi:hypothetical protein
MKFLVGIGTVLCAAASFALNFHAQPLVNLGLVGVGRGPAAAFDLLGPNVDTLGGTSSGMTLDLSTVEKNGDTFTATLYGQPDRGFGDGATDYHPRVQTYAFSVPMGYVPKVGPSFPRANVFGTLPQISTNDSGRYFNRGLEGLSLTPNGKKLVTVLQSPLQQVGEGPFCSSACHGYASEGGARTASICCCNWE